MAVPNQVVQCDQWCAEGVGGGRTVQRPRWQGGIQRSWGGIQRVKFNGGGIQRVKFKKLQIVKML